MLDLLVKRDLALIASGKSPAGSGDEAMARAILSIVDYIESFQQPRAYTAPPPYDPDTDERKEKP